jgi:UDP-N-acetylglucosamine enolpyruvyl transferase
MELMRYGFILEVTPEQNVIVKSMSADGSIDFKDKSMKKDATDLYKMLTKLGISINGESRKRGTVYISTASELVGDHFDYFMLLDIFKEIYVS